MRGGRVHHGILAGPEGAGIGRRFADVGNQHLHLVGIELGDLLRGQGAHHQGLHQRRRRQEADGDQQQGRQGAIERDEDAVIAGQRMQIANLAADGGQRPLAAEVEAENAEQQDRQEDHRRAGEQAAGGERRNIDLDRARRYGTGRRNVRRGGGLSGNPQGGKGGGARRLVLVGRKRDHALFFQIAAGTGGLVAQELRDIFPDPRHHVEMLRLHVEIQRAGNLVLAGDDAVDAGCHAIHHRGLQLVAVLLEEAVAEDADRGRIGLELLHDQIVVLPGIDIGAVLADRLAGRLAVLVVGDHLDFRELGATSVHHQLEKGVAGTGGRRRPQDLDLLRRHARIDLRPGPVGIGGQPAVDRHFLCQGQPDVPDRQFIARMGLGIRQHDAVEADPDLDDLRHAVRPAGLDLAVLDLAAGIGDVGLVLADAGAEQLQPAASAGGFHHRRLEPTGPRELFGDRRRERIDGRGTDDMDLVARLGGGSGKTDGKSDGRGLCRGPEAVPKSHRRLIYHLPPLMTPADPVSRASHGLSPGMQTVKYCNFMTVI